MASASPARDYDDQDEDEPSSMSSDSADLTPAINCDAAGENGMYGQFTWTVELPAAPADKDSLADISKIRQFSDVFEVGGYEWKLEMYPYGDSQSDKTLSVFLCAVDRKQLPGWSQTAHYQIAVVNSDPTKTSTHTGYDIFRGKRDSAWGWSKLINLSKLHDQSQGWVDSAGQIKLQATVHVVNHEYMPVIRTYRKSLCGLYYERVLQSYFEPFLKDELQRLDKLCGNSVLHKGFSDFWGALPDPKKRALLQITMDEVLLNVKARLFSRDQPATYLAADVIFKAALDCTQPAASDKSQRTLVGCTSLAVVAGGGEGTVLRLERLPAESAAGSPAAAAAASSTSTSNKRADAEAPCDQASCRVMLRTHGGVMRMSNSANFVDVFRAQVSDALDNVRALVKHLKPQSCDGTCLEALGRQMLAVFTMCGMYITNVHPAYHEKLALQLQEDLIREEEEKSQKAQQKKAKAAEKKKKMQEQKAQKKAAEEAAKREQEEEEKRKEAEAKELKRKKEEEAAKKKAEARRKAQEEAERHRKKELEEMEKSKAAEEQQKRELEEREAAERAARKEEESQERGRKAEGAGDEDSEVAKQSLIKLIMRDGALTQQEKQVRLQAIWAGKVDVGKMMAEYDSKMPADNAGMQGPAQHAMPPKQDHGAQQQQHRRRQQQPGSVSAPNVLPAAAARGQAAAAAPPPPMAPYAPMPATHSQLDLDVEAVALSAIGATGMGIDEDGIMAMALGTSDTQHQQEWGMPDAGMSATYHDTSRPFNAPFEPYSQGPNAGFSAASFDASMAPGFDDIHTEGGATAAAAGSRLFQRWAGQGPGGVPANSRLNSFLAADGGVQAGAFDGYANSNGFNGQYDFSEGAGNGDTADSLSVRLPLGARGARRP